MRSRRGPRLVADLSPTSFNDSHTPILTKSAIGRRLCRDLSATKSVTARFWTCSKPSLRLIWSERGLRLVADFLQPRLDRSGTLLRPLRLVEIVSRGEVAKRLQRMFDRGLTCPSKHRHGATLFIQFFRETDQFSRLYDTLGIRKTHSRLNPRVLTGGRVLKADMKSYIPLESAAIFFLANLFLKI